MYTSDLLRILENTRPAPARVAVNTSHCTDLSLLTGQGYEVSSDRDHAADGVHVLIVGVESLSQDPGRELEELRSRLTEDGLLVVVAQLSWGDAPGPQSISAPELISSLYEQAFVPLKRLLLEPADGPEKAPPLRRDGPTRKEILVARRDEHRVRSYRPGDESAILDLHHEAFPHEARQLDHWIWKYKNHPLGGPFISLAVDGDDRIGAHYAAYKVRFLDATGRNPRIFSGFQIGDTMTASWAHGVGSRRTSLLVRSTQHFFNRRCAHNIGFNYGFNTGKIHRYYMKIVPGSQYLEPAPYRCLDLKTRALEPFGRWARVVKGLRVDRIQSADEIDHSWDDFFETAAPAYGLLTVRDANHLRWRYFQRPDANYLMLCLRQRGRILGWSVFRRQEEVLLWGDALFLPNACPHAGALLKAALTQVGTQSVHKVAGWFPFRPAFWDAALQGLGFESRDEPQDLAFIYMEFEEQDLARRLSSGLYYTLGDSDLF